MIRLIINRYYWLIYLFVVCVSLLNAFIYPDFVSKNLYISPIIIYVVFVVASFLHKIYKDNRESQGEGLFRKLNIILVVISLSMLLLANLAEGLTYKNFVFSKFHIHPDMIIYTFFISLVELFFSLNLKETKNKVGVGLKRIVTVKTLAMPFVVLIIINNLLGIFSKMQKDTKFMISNPFATKDEIMKYKVGDLFYDYSEFVISNTEPTSKILLPPFPVYPWPQTGNAVYFRYFLYPRTLFSGKEYDPNINLKDVDYVLIAWGETPTVSPGVTHGWPKFNVPADYILVFEYGGEVKKVTGNYEYEKYKDKELWGVIKVKK